MKNIIFLRIFLFLIAIAIFEGCSKESPVHHETTENNSTGPDTRIIPGNGGIQLDGSIAGILNPAGIKAVLVAFNTNYESPENYPDSQTGSFKIDNLPQGIYNLRIEYVPNTADVYFTLIIRDIIVISKVETNLGIINL